MRGIALELLSSLGVCPPDAEVIKPHNPKIPHTDYFKIVADNLLKERSERLTVLYHTFACDVVRKGDRIDLKVRVANKDRLVSIRPKIVIDTTGDGDVGAWAGAPFEKTLPLMPMTLHFRVGNIRRTDDINRRCREVLIKLHEAGEIPMFYGPGFSFHYAEDEAYVHAIRVKGDATNADDLTRAEMQGRADAWAMFEAWKREVPGFENAYFVCVYPYIGVRETPISSVRTF